MQCPEEDDETAREAFEAQMDVLRGTQDEMEARERQYANIQGE